MMVWKNWHALLVASGSWFAFALAPAVTSNAAETVTSVWQGVYTKEQAERGKTLYFAACASCHGAVLQGDSDIPELAGVSFLRRWTDQPVGTLFAFTESQMPIGRPRGLGAQGYADVIAHILAANGFPAGEQALPAGGPVLDKIIIEKKK